MRIRRATAKDAFALAAMRYDFRAGLAPPSEPRDLFVARCTEWMARVLEDPGAEWRCWVGDDAGALLGHVWLRRVAKIPNPVGEPEAHGYVTNLFVSPAQRGRGIGERLLRTALREAEARRFDSVFLWPTPESRSLYRRNGFVADDDLMQLRRRAARPGPSRPRGTARRRRRARRSTAGTGRRSGRTP